MSTTPETRAENASANDGASQRVPPPATGSPILGTGFYRDAKPGTFGRAEWLDLLLACQDGRATCLRVLEIMEREAEFQRPSAHDLAEAFLRWPLPESVCADLCATKQGPGRVGTNLLSYGEAKQMFEQLLSNNADEPRGRKL